MNFIKLPDTNTIQKHIHYQYWDGTFWWAEPGHGRVMHEQAGFVDNLGYRRLKIEGVLYPAARIAFKITTGLDPAGVVDHIDQNPSNNKWENLRDVTVAENAANSNKVHARNTSGFRNVSWAIMSQKWRGQFRLRGHLYEAYFVTAEEANTWVIAKKQELNK